MSRRHVVYVTGTRADYGLMRAVLRAIASHPKLDLSILVTGMHLLAEFGHTADLIAEDGFRISGRVGMLMAEDTPASMARSIGIGLIGMVQAFEAIQPDIILLEGDRGESLAAAIAAAHVQIAVAHVSGGDVTAGVIDESIRHAITKFAHIHFPGTELSAGRIRAMGERPAHIHMVGTPGCDVQTEVRTGPEEVARRLDLDLRQPVILVLQHPVTTEPEAAAAQMRETMEAICALGMQTVLIYPNADAGGREMIRVIREYGRLPFLRTFENLPRELYVGLLHAASVMVGNSSSALVEAPGFGLPAVNVGRRQAARERGGNVFDAEHDRRAVKRAVEDALARLGDDAFRRRCRQTPYRDRDTAARVADILGRTEIDRRLFQKAFCDPETRLSEGAGRQGQDGAWAK